MLVSLLSESGFSGLKDEQDGIIMSNIDHIHIRHATPADAPFLAEYVMAAERGEHGPISYQQIFNLGDEALTHLLEQIAAEEIEGMELSHSNFLLLEPENGSGPIGGCAGWIEAHECLPSSLLKAQTIGYFLGQAAMKEVREALDIVGLINIPRQPGALQLESFYIHPAFRGQGLLSRLIDTHIAQWQAQQPALAQIIALSTNYRAIKAYENCGFQVVRTMETDQARIYHYFSSPGKVLLERPLNW
jgi:ribosomal protein S18 acetylase RimI-like enzyme